MHGATVHLLPFNKVDDFTKLSGILIAGGTVP